MAMGSRTPYCHMIYESSTHKKFSVKLDIVRYAQQKGNKPAARRFGCSKNTVKLWRHRFETNGVKGLTDRRRGPKVIPHKTSQKEEMQIIKAREQAPCYGPKRLKWAYNLSVSEGAIARILKVHNLTRKQKKKYQRKNDLRAVKAKMYKALSHHQEDVKHLYDIPYYWEQFQRLGLPKYQYTLRDAKSGFLLLGFCNEYSEAHSMLMTEKYFDHLVSFGIKTSEITIQTDNGSEFGARKHINKPGFVNTIVCQLGAKHQYIQPERSNANEDVDRVH